MYPWTVPDEVIEFTYAQFVRFDTPPPTEKSVDTIASFVLEYVVQHHYYPLTQTEAAARYMQPGLTEPEKYQLLGPLEYQLKFSQHITLEQLHLAAWAVLLFAWSEDGSTYVHWQHYVEAQTTSRAKPAGQVA